MAGRLTPLIRPIRSSAEAMVAPVLPAETMADALPSRTASAARTSEESFIRRTLAPGSASMAITSEAGQDLQVTGQWPEDLRLADQQDPHAQLGHRPVGARDDLVRCLVPTHRIDRDGKHRGQSTSMAWRPAYQPQLPHTTWGTLVAPQRGHRLRDGRSRVQALARRLRLLALEVFFFGTAIGSDPQVRATERARQG